MKLHDCTTWLRVRDYYTTGDATLESLRCRQHLLCQSCSIVRGARVMSKILRSMDAVRQSAPPLLAYVLTVTVKDGPDLGERAGHLRRSWSRLLDDRRARGRRRGNSLTPVTGGVYSMEHIRGANSGQWHAHLHALVLAESPLPVTACWDGRKERWVYRFDQLSQEWRAITGDSFVVECHPVRPKDSDGADSVPNTLEALCTTADPTQFLGAVCEISKYALKVSSLGDRDVVTAWTALRDRQLCGTFGVLRGLNLHDDEARSQQLLLREIAPFVESEYRWQPGGYSVRNWRMSAGNCNENPGKIANISDFRLAL